MKKHQKIQTFKWRSGLLCALLSCMLLLSASCQKSAQRSSLLGAPPRLFGATYMTMNNPFFQVVNDALGDFVEANGDIFIARDPANDPDKQNEQIFDMIEEGIDVLFLNPVDWKSVKPALEACAEAGVAVFNIDTQVYDTEYVVSIIESDNYGAGVLCAEDLMARKRNAKVLVLDSPMMTSITQRVQGFLDTLKDHPEYEIVYQTECFGELETTLEVMGQIMQMGIEFDVVLGGNDPTALGALAALQQNRREEGILIYGIDGSPDFMAMLKESESSGVTGTSVQSPRTIAITAAETAYDYLNGETVESYILIPVWFLTRDNLDDVGVFDWQ